MKVYLLTYVDSFGDDPFTSVYETRTKAKEAMEARLEFACKELEIDRFTLDENGLYEDDTSFDIEDGPKAWLFERRVL